jgi:hypothetical protein
LIILYYTTVAVCGFLTCFQGCTSAHRLPGHEPAEGSHADGCAGERREWGPRPVAGIDHAHGSCSSSSTGRNHGGSSSSRTGMCFSHPTWSCTAGQLPCSMHPSTVGHSMLLLCLWVSTVLFSSLLLPSQSSSVHLPLTRRPPLFVPPPHHHPPPTHPPTPPHAPWAPPPPRPHLPVPFFLMPPPLHPHLSPYPHPATSLPPHPTLTQVLVTDPKELEAIRQRESDITKERVQKILDAGERSSSNVG